MNIRSRIWRWKYRRFQAPRKTMCDDCAFRDGSRERLSPWRWSGLLSMLQRGDIFLCHKTMFNPSRFRRRGARYDATRRPDGSSCPAHDHPVCAGFAALFKERFHHVQR